MHYVNLYTVLAFYYILYSLIIEIEIENLERFTCRKSRISRQYVEYKKNNNYICLLISDNKIDELLTV